MEAAKVGKKDGTRTRERKADSRAEKEKVGTQEDGAPKGKGKQCKVHATTADKLDTQPGCAHNHQAREKGKESRAHAGPVGKQGTGLRSAQKEKD